MADIPTHIGFIVDGNRRWAEERGLAPFEGHKAGKEVVVDIMTAAIDQGVEYVSEYVFSTENWKRSKAEVGKLMDLTVHMAMREYKRFIDRDIRVRVMGSREGLSKKVIRALDNIEEKTRDCKRGQAIICFNYGGQQEIADAVKSLMQDGTAVDDVTPELIAEHLYLPDVPPCDVIVRTSGEERLSNYMLWRAAYSEMMYIDKNWPDMTKQDVTDILNEYTDRNRRFGG